MHFGKEREYNENVGRHLIIFCKKRFIFILFLIYADESDVSVVSLDDQLEDWTDKEISDFVSFDLYYTCMSFSTLSCYM